MGLANLVFKPLPDSAGRHCAAGGNASDQCAMVIRNHPKAATNALDGVESPEDGEHCCSALKEWCRSLPHWRKTLAT